MPKTGEMEFTTDKSSLEFGSPKINRNNHDAAKASNRI